MAISYTGTPYLSSGSNTIATVTNTNVTVGTFTSTTGLSINTITGEINLIASTPGTYVVTFSDNQNTTLVIQHSFDNIKDLYNQTLLLDKTYVDNVMREIKAEIFTRVNANNLQYFEYNTQPLLGALEAIQQLRIKDQIILQLRDMGIRVSSRSLLYAPWLFPLQATPQITNYILPISWTIRDAREYMKSYCYELVFTFSIIQPN